MVDIAENIQAIEASIKGKAQLLAISKKQGDSKITEAYAYGLRSFGENYVQELLRKEQIFPKDIEWHMIGHLQSNKVKFIAPFVHLIHSVDSLKLLKEINKQALKNNRVIDCLIQVKIAEEETKSGINEEGLISILEFNLSALKNVKIKGLMGMSTNSESEDLIISEFRSLKSIFDNIKHKFPKLGITELSMGMSNDWPLAIENGSTLIRVGSGVFGARL